MSASPAQASAGDFLEQVLARSAHLDAALPALRAQRETARDALASTGLPDGRTEQWKYTPIARFYDPRFYQTGVAADAPAASSVARAPSPVHDVVPVRLSGAHAQFDPAKVPSGLTLASFAAADGNARTLLTRWLNRDIDDQRHELNRVNLALLDDGLLVHVPPDTAIALPVDLSLHDGDRGANCARILVVLEHGSQLTLLERHLTTATRNVVLEVHLERDASLTHYRVQSPSPANAWQLLHANVERGARYRLYDYAFGGAPHRNEVHVRLLGRDADVELRGALVATGREKLDLQLCVEHVGPGGRSRQQFHGIALDRSELTFNGRIHIHPQAQKSDARLSNRNLLGHDNARVNTKPELEIYADDVQCAHGATVGQLSADALFYLQSRGVPRALARTMLLRGFIGEVLPAEDSVLPLTALFDEVLARWTQ
jgi:Fe-S cluster assembly protein SufD